MNVVLSFGAGPAGAVRRDPSEATGTPDLHVVVLEKLSESGRAYSLSRRGFWDPVRSGTL